MQLQSFLFPGLGLFASALASASCIVDTPTATSLLIKVVGGTVLGVELVLLIAVLLLWLIANRIWPKTCSRQRLPFLLLAIPAGFISIGCALASSLLMPSVANVLWAFEKHPLSITRALCAYPHGLWLGLIPTLAIWFLPAGHRRTGAWSVALLNAGLGFLLLWGFYAPLFLEGSCP